MVEVTGNLWDYPADARVITTNGFVKVNGECVMGRGCASEARQRWPGVAANLGLLIQQKGNHVHIIKTPGPDVWWVSFPVKHRWFEKANLPLISQSCEELLNLTNDRGWQRVVVPRPGCGNGGLKWEDVAGELELWFDNRFHVITHA